MDIKRKKEKEFDFTYEGVDGKEYIKKVVMKTLTTNEEINLLSDKKVTTQKETVRQRVRMLSSAIVDFPPCEGWNEYGIKERESYLGSLPGGCVAQLGGFYNSMSEGVNKEEADLS